MMSRLSQFSVFLVLLLSTRRGLNPQAADGYVEPSRSPYRSDINFQNRQLRQMSRMMKNMHTEIQNLRSSLAQLTELKSIPTRLNDLEARQEESNSTVEALVAVVKELDSRHNGTVVRQQERFTDFCRTRRMGMSTGAIPDSSITASSVLSQTYLPKYGRFGIIRSWIPTEANNQWLQIDLGQESRVYGVITQGRPDYGRWARSYKLAFSDDGETWTTYADIDGSDKVFQGNYDKNSPVYNFLDPPVTTQYVKFLPKTYNVKPVMRVEILGCPTDLL